MKQNIDYDGMADQGRVPSPETKKLAPVLFGVGSFYY